MLEYKRMRIFFQKNKLNLTLNNAEVDILLNILKKQDTDSFEIKGLTEYIIERIKIMRSKK